MASAHHSAQASRYSLPSLPNSSNEFRLPSLKDLNFQYRPPGHEQNGSAASLPNTSPQAEHVGSSQSQSARHDASWTRPSPTTPVSAMPPQHQQHPHIHTNQHPHQHQHHQQHSPPLSAGHEQHSSRLVDYTPQRHDNGGYLTPGLPLSAQVTPIPGSVTIGPGSRGGEDSHSQHPSKRSRTNSGMSVPRDTRPSHHQASYPVPQNPQYSTQPQASYHQVQPTAPPPPPPHEQVHQQTGPGGYPHPQYGYPPPQYMPPPPRTHNVQPPHPQQQQQQQPPPPPPPQANPYAPPPLQQESWEHQQHQQAPPPPPPPHHHQHQQPPPHLHHQPHPPPLQHPQYQAPPPHQQMGFARTTALVPQNVDSRAGPSSYSPNMAEREHKMSEIVKHCTVLYQFASRYAQLQTSLPHVQPTPQELAEMKQRAAEVVRLLEEYRRLSPELDTKPSISAIPLDRPPKRPWEDVDRDGHTTGGSASYGEPGLTISKSEQTTAEQDMEIIRTKRATSVAGGASAGTGQPKSKYRKRSRATPPGKCHSCNIRETPEWRRGPDGARTLCNACGLHYAKLMRKRDKQIATEGQAPRIDMETLRASARAAEAEKSHARAQAQGGPSTSKAPGGITPPIGGGEQSQSQSQSHHQGSFQVVNMGPGGPSPSQHQPQVGGVAPPPSNWSAHVGNGKGRGGYPPPPEMQQQHSHSSFMRTSQHAGSRGASPR